MNELVKTQTTHPLLAPNVLKVVKDELFATVQASIAKCFADLNARMSDNPEYLVNEVVEDIQEHFPSMRLVEIPEAFANGIRGKYGEYFGLCVISFHLFVKGYLESPERLQLVEQRKQLIEASIEKSPDEKFNIQKELCLELSGKTPAQFKLMAAGVYDFLNELALIHPDFKMGIMKEGLALLIEEKSVEINFCLDRERRRKLIDSLNTLQEGIAKDQISPDHYKECKRVAKRIGLTNWLRDIEFNATNLAQLIEDRREFYKEQLIKNNK